MWFFKYVYVKWEHEARLFLYIQKHLQKVCLCVFNIPQVANILNFFKKHWALLIFKAKSAKLKSRDTEIGQLKNIKWLKNIVLTRVVQIKKN